jgi:phosphoglycerol geranylgeranyltransferase
MSTVLHSIEAAHKEGRKQLAVLIDPDFGQDEMRLERTVQNACMANADLIFVGGSLLTSAAFDRCVQLVKSLSDRPVVLFPGSPSQLSAHADAVLFLSLISGRNPELLIGHHVTAAPSIKALGIEAIPTGYLLVDGGKPTTVSYVSQTIPLPHDKPGIAAATALAGSYLGSAHHLYGYRKRCIAHGESRDDPCSAGTGGSTHYRWWWDPGSRHGTRTL